MDYTVRGQSNVWRLPKYWLPTPSPPPGECVPPPLMRGGGHTRWVKRGWGANSSEDDRHWSVLYICKYFVRRTNRISSVTFIEIILLNVVPRNYLDEKSYESLTQRGQYILFSVVFTISPSHNGSVWFITVISLLLTNTVSPVRAYLIIWWDRFRETQKEGDRESLSI